MLADRRSHTTLPTTDVARLRMFVDRPGLIAGSPRAREQDA